MILQSKKKITEILISFSLVRKTKYNKKKHVLIRKVLEEKIDSMKIVQFQKFDDDIIKAKLSLTGLTSWQTLLDQATIELGKNFKLSGFRLGKVPLEILKKKLNSRAILDKAANFGLRKGYDFVLKTHQKELEDKYRFKKYEILKLTFEELELEFEWETLPKIELGPYKDLQLALPELKVTDAQIEAEITSLKQSHAEYSSKNDPQIMPDDFVTVTYDTFENGKPLASEQGEAIRFQFGRNTVFAPEFETALLKLPINQQQTIKVTYPATAKFPALAGKTVTHHVQITQIATQMLPKMAKLLKIKNVKTEADLRKQIVHKLQVDQQNQHKQTVLQAIKKAILANSQAKISQSYLETEYQTMRANILTRLKDNKRTLSAYLQENQQTEAEFELELRAVVERNIKELLMLFEVARREAIDVPDDEVEAYYKMLATRLKTPLEEVKKTYPPVVLTNHLLRGKVENFLLVVNNNEKQQS